jgi:hypothetical protein
MPKKKQRPKPATTNAKDPFPGKIASWLADHECVQVDPRGLPDPDELSDCDIPLELRQYEGVEVYPFPVQRLAVHFLLLLDSYYEVRPESQVASGVWKSELHALLLKEYAAAQEWPLCELENRTTTPWRFAKWIIKEQIAVVDFPWAHKFLWLIRALPKNMGGATAGAPLALAEASEHAGGGESAAGQLRKADLVRALMETHEMSDSTARRRVRKAKESGTIGPGPRWTETERDNLISTARPARGYWQE